MCILKLKTWVTLILTFRDERCHGVIHYRHKFTVRDFCENAATLNQCDNSKFHSSCPDFVTYGFVMQLTGFFIGCTLLKQTDEQKSAYSNIFSTTHSLRKTMEKVAVSDLLSQFTVVNAGVAPLVQYCHFLRL